jgi:AcrR family transcriptional regulator
MSKGPRLTPRKAPQQGRAKSTVDAILIAMARVLVAEGFDALTTNRVAELAGVSVGSLYQYFPSKESLLAALYRHVRAQRLATIGDALVSAGGHPIAEAAPIIARAAVEAYAEDPSLDRALAAVAPAIGAARKAADVDANLAHTFGSFLERHRAHLAGRDPMQAGFLLARALDATLGAVTLEHPEWLDEPWLEVEIEALVRGFVAPGR